MNNSLAMVHPDLAVQWSERNNPVTPDDVSYGSKKIFWWVGTCGHEWDASVKARSMGEKCPLCAGKRIVPGMNDLRTMHRDLAKEWSRKNGKLRSTEVSPGSSKKVWWKGKCGHEWQASIKNRVNGSGCPYCSHNAILAGFNDLESQLPEVAAEWSERNYPLRACDVSPFANKKAWWKCSEGHEWETLISTRSGGSRCPYCSGIKLLPGFNDFSTTQQEIAKEWSERRNSLRPDMVNEKSQEKVWWECSQCGHEWKSTVIARVHGRKCPVCAEREVKPGLNDLCTSDPALVLEWDYERNKGITPDRISRNSLKPVWWKCSYGHSYKEKIGNRVHDGCGCKICTTEFYHALPKLLAEIYGERYDLRMETDDTEPFGLHVDAYFPDAALVFLFPDTDFLSEARAVSLLEYLCRRENIRLASFVIRRNPKQMCTEIRKGFQQVGINITSEYEKDIQEARQLFDSRRKNIIGNGIEEDERIQEKKVE